MRRETTEQLLDEYQRVLREQGPDSDAAYDLLTHHINEIEFIHRAETERLSYTQRRQVARCLLLFAPFYFALLAAFLLMYLYG